MKQQMSRREFVKLSASVIGVGALAGCVAPQSSGGQGGAGAPGAAPVEIRLAEGSWVGPEGIAFWTDEIIPAFQEANNGITITFENAESPDYEDKLFTQIVAGDAPDVMFIWGGTNYNLMQKGQLLVLDDHFDPDALADFYPAKLAAHYLDGHLLGMPKYVSTVAMAYNKDLLDEAGVPYPDESWDWNQYLEAFRKTTKRDADGKLTQWGTYVAQDYLGHHVWANGGEWMNAELFGTKLLINEPKALEALHFDYNLIYGDEPVSPKPGEVPDMGWWDVFSTGKIAFIESHSWAVTNYMRDNDFQWDFTLLAKAPSGGRAGVTFADGYGIPKNTKEPDAAVTLLKFLTSAEAQKMMCLSIVGLQPTRRSAATVWDTESMGAKAGYNVSAFSEIMEVARIAGPFQDAAKISTEIWAPIWDKIWVTGEMGLEEGVNELTQKIDQYFGNA